MLRTIILTIAAVLALAGVAEARSPSLVAYVDVSSQTMTVSMNGRALYNWRVSTGRRPYVTPRGTYKPTRMHRMWYSRKYDMSPMPYSVFFRGGYAIHGTEYVRQLGQPASHGCVRLDTRNAAIFYALVKEVGPAQTRIVLAN